MARSSYLLTLVLAPFLLSSLRAEETRAMWVVRHSLTSPASIDRMVEEAARNGFNTLLVQVRGRGDAYYRSRLEPRAVSLKDQPEDFDPLARVLRRAHQHGLRVHAWINTYLVTHLSYLPRSSRHLVYRHPEWLMVPRALADKLYSAPAEDPSYLRALASFARRPSSHLEGLYLDPAHPGVQEQLRNICMDILSRYDLDGLHFDYVRYPNPQWGFGRTPLEQFRAGLESSLGEDERAALRKRYPEDRLIYTRLYREEWDDFRRRQITSLVERIYRTVKTRQPDLLVTAAVVAGADEAGRLRSQDWRSWIRLGILDGICPMAYGRDARVFRRQIEQVHQLAPGTRIWPGIGAYRLSASRTLEMIRIARELDSGGFVLFSYNSLTAASQVNPRGENLQLIGRMLEEDER